MERQSKNNLPEEFRKYFWDCEFDELSIEKYISEGGGLFSFDMYNCADNPNNIIWNIINFKVGESLNIQESVLIKALDTNHYITEYKADYPVKKAFMQR